MPHRSNGHRLNLASRAHALSDGFGSIKESVAEVVERKLSDLKSASSRAAKAGSRKLSELRSSTGKTVSRNPFSSVLVATGAGVLLGYLWGRR